MLFLIHLLLLFSLNICCQLTYGDKIYFKINETEGEKAGVFENSECTINGTQIGTCQYIKNCPEAVLALQSNIRPDVCGFAGSEVMVCCITDTALKESTNETSGVTKLNSECIINGTQTGTCQHANNCPAAVQALRVNSRPHICGFDGNEVMFCCVPNTELKDPTNKTLEISNLNSKCTINGTQTGTCQHAKTCPAAVGAPRVNTRPDTCGFDGSEAMVCCDISRKVKELTNDTMGISRRMCSQYENELCGKDFYKAPVKYYIFVGGGRKAESREFPHMAAIGYGSPSEIVWYCGGSLISDRYVLSAAHCTNLGNRIGSARWVRLGDLDIKSNDDDARPEDFEIIQHINHPDYRPPHLYNDIALYKLNRPVRFNEYIKPICLHMFNQIPSGRGVATGWGRQGYAHPVSNILMKVELTFVSPRYCSPSGRRSSFQLPNGIDSKRMVCAGEDEGVKDTCQGDSGGPLSIDGKKCIPTQVGITSAGSVCGLPNSPGIYTRIAHFVPWIESIVWRSD